MQQAARNSRFWWRALEAPTPETGPSTVSVVMPRSTPHADATDLYADPDVLELRLPTRAAGRRKKAGIHVLSTLVVMLCLVGGTAAVYFWDQPVVRQVSREMHQAVRLGAVATGFGIQQVSVIGQQYTRDEDVFDALDLPNIQTFWDLDATAALNRIERIPWVDKARITRIFPSQLQIEITERTPMAIWASGSSSYLVDVTGRTLGRLAADHQWKLPVLAGRGANSQLKPLLTALVRYPALRENLARAERVAKRRWRMVLTNGSTIELGPDREIDGLDSVFSNNLLRRAALADQGFVIDMRTDGRVVVRPRTQKLQSAAMPSVPAGGT